MENDTDPARKPRTFFQWATTPPQSYAVYLIALILIWGLSFYAGTLKPKNTPNTSPPPVTAPKS